MSDDPTTPEEVEAFDYDSAVDAERTALKELIRRLGNQGEYLQEQAAAALKLSAQIAVDRMKGQDVGLAIKGLSAIKANIQSATTTEVAAGVIAYLEGTVIRIVGLGAHGILSA